MTSGAVPPVDEVQAARDVLADPTSSLTRVLRALPVVEEAAAQLPAVRVGVSSSATVDLLGTHLRRHGVLAGVRVEVVPGNHDDPVGDLARFAAVGVDHVVLLPLFDELLPAFEAQLPGLPGGTVDAVELRMRDRLRLALAAARDVAPVTLGSFHRLGPALDPGGRDAVAGALDRFDATLRDEAARHGHVQVLDTAEVVTTVGRSAAVDMRFHLSATAPWTSAFLSELARRVVLSSRAFGTRFAKVLVLDCDGTLWGGVVGEETVSGIALDPHEHPGNVFWRIQHDLAALRRRGVLLCLCTKNEPADVDEVLSRHPHSVLRRDDFAAVRVNWQDKPANLRSLADELGLGLSSMVFLDDSAFECAAVRAQLPEVTTVQVPATLSRYQEVLAGIGELFGPTGPADGVDKTEQYRRRAMAEELRSSSVDHESYLASLGLQVRLGRDLPADAARIAELSAKTNQFNLSLRRYGPGEVQGRTDSAEHLVYGIEVLDVFGSAGLTGAVVLALAEHSAEVENVFLSCRVLGRGVEDAVWPAVAADLGRRGITEITARYVPGPRNAQVADFYDRLGFTADADADGTTTYRGAVTVLPTAPPSWIELTTRG